MSESKPGPQLSHCDAAPIRRTRVCHGQGQEKVVALLSFPLDMAKCPRLTLTPPHLHNYLGLGLGLQAQEAHGRRIVDGGELAACERDERLPDAI